MKKVTIKELTLTNWRGERRRTTNFDPISTTIAGGNGLGKSRHFDAFMWLLFGKDSQDRKDYNVKTIVDGEPLQKTNSEVVGVLDVDGEEVVLRRTLVEEWVKPRGQAEQVFKGNKTECSWNDVPVSVSEYQKRVSTIIDDKVFKMVTNPRFFVTMPWKDQREQLFGLAGAVSDREIGGMNPEFAKLLDKLNGKSFEDYKRELSSRKKRLKQTLLEIHPRIDQTQKLMPEKINFEEIEANILELDRAIEEVDKSINSLSKRNRTQYESIQEHQASINALKLKQQNILLAAKSEAQEKAAQANAERRAINADIEKCKRTIGSSERQIANNEAAASKLRKKSAEVESKISELREEWYEINEEQYEGGTTCRCCGQEIPEEMKNAALSKFKEDKKRRLSEKSAEGKEMAGDLEKINKAIKDIETDTEEYQNDLAQKKEHLKIAQDKLQQMPEEVKAEDVNAEEIPEYKQCEQEIQELEKTINGIESQEKSEGTTEYREKKRSLVEQRDKAKEMLAKKGQIEECEQEIQELEEEGQKLSQQIADAESEEYVVQQFSIAKIEECENRINKLFSLVKFKLFEYTIEDSNRENPIETCIPLVDGVPYPTANTAGQVNAGLDIINTLTRFYGVSAPIFIDGRESVNELIHTDSQLINLVVTTDKELIIK